VRARICFGLRCEQLPGEVGVGDDQCGRNIARGFVDHEQIDVVWFLHGADTDAILSLPGLGACFREMPQQSAGDDNGQEKASR
jgi:hypothetical protein